MFRSGQVHRYDAVVFAIGTIPNIEIESAQVSLADEVLLWTNT
jgi:pyruvate/2-oxoglutarate dehydrogenase complex dihydrolipoamide dehydrogenase (E3) component